MLSGPRVVNQVRATGKSTVCCARALGYPYQSRAERRVLRRAIQGGRFAAFPTDRRLDYDIGNPMRAGPITIFGADSCERTLRSRQHLDHLAIGYHYINIERNPPAADWVREQNDGRIRTPTIDVAGLVLSSPSNGELDVALRKQGRLSHRSEIDAIHPPPTEPG